MHVVGNIAYIYHAFCLEIMQWLKNTWAKFLCLLILEINFSAFIKSINWVVTLFSLKKSSLAELYY